MHIGSRIRILPTHGGDWVGVTGVVLGLSSAGVTWKADDIPSFPRRIVNRGAWRTSRQYIICFDESGNALDGNFPKKDDVLEGNDIY